MEWGGRSVGGGGGGGGERSIVLRDGDLRLSRQRGRWGPAPPSSCEGAVGGGQAIWGLGRGPGSALTCPWGKGRGRSNRPKGAGSGGRGGGERPGPWSPRRRALGAPQSKGEGVACGVRCEGGGGGGALVLSCAPVPCADCRLCTRALC